MLKDPTQKKTRTLPFPEQRFARIERFARESSDARESADRFARIGPSKAQSSP